MPKYTLIITEKPDAANRIATALDVNGKPNKIVRNGVPYYKGYRNGEIVIVPALGHLYTIISKQNGKRDYPTFDYRWVPRYQAERKVGRIRAWIKVITELAKDAEAFVDACDFDIEGSIIGYTILKFACGNKERVAKRMKYSTLTEEELRESYSNLAPNLDFAFVESGLTRHEVDWLYGINLSRALIQAVKTYSAKYATLSTGRVQGPTLKFLVETEKAIQCFVPTPYWIVRAKIIIDDLIVEVKYDEAIETLDKAKALRDSCKIKEGEIQAVTFSEYVQNPPLPFDLGTLQSEAYRLFKYSPIRTSKILQHLYLSAIISYPRTSSQKLPFSIGYKNILKKLCNSPDYFKSASELLLKEVLKPNEGKKEDSAHPAIYPTGNLSKKPLDTSEKNIFDLVIKRFFAVFGDPAIYLTMKITLSINGTPFHFSASKTLKEGWLSLYKPYVQIKNEVLPSLKEGQHISVQEVDLKEYFTRPPERYNPRSLLLKMEKEGVGTKATRASIIQTLQERNYSLGTDKLAVSDLGFEVTEVLEKYCPEVISSEMTRLLEEKMDTIQQGKETKQKVLLDITEKLRIITSQLKDKEKEVGTQLSQAIEKLRLKENLIGFCTNCERGKLVILRSKKTGKRFVGCTNYFEGRCSKAYPLPQKGLVKSLPDLCKRCGTPTVAVFSKGKKPWHLCLNPKCPSKGEKTNEM